MFEPVESRVNLSQVEEEVLKLWREQGTFRKSVEARKDGPLFTFYEGPPTANGSPGIHHVISRAFKDIIPRYKAMKGFYTPRIAGWDTHGLPVELEVEKNLGFSGKEQIEQYGVEKFNKKCRESVFRYKEQWDKLTERIAFWVDLDNPYITMDNGYIESVWWIIKQMWDKGLLYKGYKTAAHCPRCGTSLSSHEVALGYREDTEDPSVFIQFEVTDAKNAKDISELAEKTGKKAYLLAWTTTPWTLPGNTALAVSAESEYVILELEDKLIIMAKALISAVGLEEVEELASVNGADLAGAHYKPLYNPHDYQSERYRFPGDGSSKLELQDEDKELTYAVISANFVSMSDGSGIVHVAPAFGEVDFEAGKSQGFDFVQHVDASGIITGNYSFSGKFVKDADKVIMEDLKERGLLLKSGIIKHTYPFCWRCGAPVLYYVKTTWYIKTTAVKDRLISGNQEINWYPEHIKNGRFGDWLENNVDWALSRERYWGTPLPVWQCKECGKYECIGSLEELGKKEGFSGFEGELDLHRPYVDELTYKCSDCGGETKRVTEVIDCWFDSGAMPIAQWNYPFDESSKTIREDGRHPADFICEAVDQTRGWFYSLHAISTLIFGEPCFKNAISLGHILDAKGDKMSKSKGNVVEPWKIIDKYGADALRWYLYTSTPPGNPKRFSEQSVNEVTRQFILTMWNVYSFFVTYANIDAFDPKEVENLEVEYSELDRWILSELNQLVDEVDTKLDNYDPTEAGRKIEAFVDYLSNWYVRRSRRRFWRSENDDDKIAGYKTLYHCLVTLCKLIAPFMPMLAEAMYQNLVLKAYPDASESVHLADFPGADLTLVDSELSQSARLAMKLSSMGRAARSKAGIKVRQPLSHAVIKLAGAGEQPGVERVKLQILEELNIKDIKYTDDADLLSDDSYAKNEDSGYVVAISKELTEELKEEGFIRDLVHHMQSMRRNAGFEIADYINVNYSGDNYSVSVIKKLSEYIKRETLAKEITEGVQEDAPNTKSLKIGGHEVTISVEKV